MLEVGCIRTHRDHHPEMQAMFLMIVSRIVGANIGICFLGRAVLSNNEGNSSLLLSLCVMGPSITTKQTITIFPQL
jgi:L-lactate utilization protein LutB